MDKFRKKFKAGVFSTQGKLVINSGDLLCHVSQINDVKGDNSFGEPFIELNSEQNLDWEYLHSMDKIPKIDFFDIDFKHVRNEVWEIIKKSPSEKWLIITNEPLSHVDNLLPDYWEADAYSNVIIALVNYDAVPYYILPKNFMAVSSNDNETFNSFDVLISNLDKGSVDSYFWIISGIGKPKITYKF